MTIPNVLAARYASAELTALWSPEEKIRMERRLWLAVLRAQRDLGVSVPEGAVEAYESVLDHVDLASIAGSGSLCASVRTSRLLSMARTEPTSSTPAPSRVASRPATCAIGPTVISPSGTATNEPTMSYE